METVSALSREKPYLQEKSVKVINDIFFLAFNWERRRVLLLNALCGITRGFIGRKLIAVTNGLELSSARANDLPSAILLIENKVLFPY